MWEPRVSILTYVRLQSCYKAIDFSIFLELNRMIRDPTFYGIGWQRAAAC
jgi:hypothetical protein